VRIAELLRSGVVDAAGTPVGNVEDVRLVQDSSYIEGFGAALRLDGLVVGTGAVAARLGYHRHGVRGPWLLKRIFRWLERRARYVQWSHVAEWDGETVRLSCLEAELPTLHELPEENT
jgi:hypothetical protein